MKERGQFFTESLELRKSVFDLCRNKGRSLEPSAGTGCISEYFKDNGKRIDVSVEIDESLNFKDKDIIIMNFFDYSVEEKFDTIVGNPPYVKNNLIEELEKIETEYSSLNLYLYFIEKSFNHLNDKGEIVFIIPREFFTSSRASGIRETLYNNGTITDVIDYQERKMFDDADPYVVIIRYEKGNLSHSTNYVVDGKSSVKKEIFQNGFIKFIKKEGVPLSDFFEVKVGIVSGANDIYQNDELGNVEIICSDFIRTKKRKKFIFFERDYPKSILEYLSKFKERLISRRIRDFDEDNWFEWGAVRNLEEMKKSGSCIYVNSKTREERPFFKEEVGYFDGSILALIPKENLDLDEWVELLNNNRDSFAEQGMVVGNKLQLTQNSLSNFLVDIHRRVE